MEKLFWRPYKAHFGAFIAPGGRKSVKAGYYLHLEDGMSVLEIFSAMYPFNAFLTRGTD